MRISPLFRAEKLAVYVWHSLNKTKSITRVVLHRYPPRTRRK